LTPPAGSVSRTRIAFVDLVPMWRGRRVPDAPPFDPARAAQMGLVIGDKQAGAFELGLVAIRVLYP
jgi:monofunctional biosynthetic peptidoglycan transglycosylase